VSTGGRDETTIREYIQKQEAEDQRLDQLEIFARYRHRHVAVDLPTALSGSHFSRPPALVVVLTCAEHARQLGGESPLPNRMEVKG
jgi:hypothetical protein